MSIYDSANEPTRRLNSPLVEAMRKISKEAELPPDIPIGTTINRVCEIAVHVRALTYGEMITLATGIWEARGDVEITEATLPKVLHAWATGR